MRRRKTSGLMKAPPATLRMINATIRSRSRSIEQPFRSNFYVSLEVEERAIFLAERERSVQKVDVE
jgi:hypothetical protein